MIGSHFEPDEILSFAILPSIESANHTCPTVCEAEQNSNSSRRIVPGRQSAVCPSLLEASMNASDLMGTFGMVAGLIVAVGLLLLAAWFVAHARGGNRRVREARHDPHVDAAPYRKKGEDRRDIGQ